MIYLRRKRGAGASAYKALNVADDAGAQPFLRFSTLNLGGATEALFTVMASFVFTNAGAFRPCLIGINGGGGSNHLLGFDTGTPRALKFGLQIPTDTTPYAGLTIGTAVDNQRVDVLAAVDGTTDAFARSIYRTWSGATPGSFVAASDGFGGSWNLAQPVTLCNAHTQDNRPTVGTFYGLAAYPGLWMDLSTAGAITFAQNLFGSTLGAAVDRSILDTELGGLPAVAQPEDATSLTNPGTIGNFELTQGVFTNAA